MAPRWVLGDRTQAPSGAGFALENRVATTRALSDIYSDMNIQRLAGFFRAFHDTLFTQAKRDGGRVGILTPGQLNDTYFEHAYIARYLGLMLLEGEDLVVEDERVMVRTVAGLKPVTVLWRRMDASFVDPLELRYDSRIGTPGMVEALRHGSISMINALGTGLLETGALAAFMPRLAQKLLGTNLLLPEIATRWCGQPGEQRHVLDNFDKLMIGPAFATTLPFDDQRGTMLGSAVPADQREALLERIRTNGADYVGREQVQLSTAPVYVDGKLRAPRHHPARLCGPHRKWLDHYARRLRPGRLHQRRFGPCHAARRPGGRRLGGVVQAGGTGFAPAARRPEAGAKFARQSAQPRRR
ncbi:circularly permuted type 2 ATP-grasp protein [Devosia sp. A8/3-2]|nr:circularly permuted type 2 ATP-grasp protein [Devosia sp. A8/3-2]